MAGFELEKMELGCRVEFVEKNELEGVFSGWLTRWFMGVDGVFHCRGVYAWRGVLGVVGVGAVKLICGVGVLGLKGSAGRVEG
jgi:hypothetical protein